MNSGRRTRCDWIWKSINVRVAILKRIGMRWRVSVVPILYAMRYEHSTLSCTVLTLHPNGDPHAHTAHKSIAESMSFTSNQLISVHFLLVIAEWTQLDNAIRPSCTDARTHEYVVRCHCYYYWLDYSIAGAVLLDMVNVSSSISAFVSHHASIYLRRRRWPHVVYRWCFCSLFQTKRTRSIYVFNVIVHRFWNLFSDLINWP